MAIDLGKILDTFNDALFPGHTCACCGEEMKNKEWGVCEECKNGLNLHNEKCCQKCGEPLDDIREKCPACVEEHYEFKRAISCCEYNEVSGKLIKDLKYNDKKYIAKIIAKFLAEAYSKSGVKADLVTFVPSSKITMKERGFNQGKLIAEEFSLLTGIPCADLLVRAKEVNRQATLSGQERKENLKGAFKTKGNLNLRGQNLLLIDDVFSTGTTLSECSKALKSTRPKSIICLTFAKVHFLKAFESKIGPDCKKS